MRKWCKKQFDTWGKRKEIRFLTLAGMSFVLNPGLTFLLHEGVHLSERIAYAIALTTVFTFNFFMLRKWVYQAEAESAGKQGLRFISTTILFRLTEYVLFLLLTHMTSFHYLLIVLGISCTATILKFFTFGKHVFRQTQPS